MCLIFASGHKVLQLTGHKDHAEKVSELFRLDFPYIRKSVLSHEYILNFGKWLLGIRVTGALQEGPRVHNGYGKAGRLHYKCASSDMVFRPRNFIL